jgi:hypothetical protein
MSERWTNGWGNGLTGPNTPPIQGVTVNQSIAHHDWVTATKGRPESEWPEYPKCMNYFVPISKGSDTIAVVVGPNRKGHAALIAVAPELLEALQGIIEIGKRDMTNPKYDGYFEYAKEVIRRSKA